MNDNLEKTAKTDRDYWDKGYPKGGFLPGLTIHRAFPYIAVNYRLNLLFKKHLTPGDKRILDIGCGSGKWLVYFHQLFGFQVYGVDYSERVCQIAKETLRRNKVTGEIICGDIFDASFQNQYEEYFDVVTSMGVVEHFADPTGIIDIHLKLLKRGGNLIITIPNFGDGSLYRKAQKIFNREKELLRTHNVELMKVPNFRKHLERFENLEIKMLDYIGPLSIVMAPWRYGLGYLLRPLNELIGYLTFFLHAETFSPHIVLIARKL